MMVIVIPVYKEKPDYYEQVSLKRTISVAGDFHISFLAPENFDRTWYLTLREENTSWENFSSAYFTNGLSGYNELMLSPALYDRFSKYDNMLLVQSDVYLLSERLANWSTSRFDYIGAPWINVDWLKPERKAIFSDVLSSQGRLKSLYTKVRWNLGLSSINVGNGGLSLRKTRSFYQATKKFSRTISKWQYSEDIFWSLFMPMQSPSFKVASQKKALEFAFDSSPAICYSLSNHQLPFGAHAWYRDEFPYQGNRSFWLPIIESIENKSLRP
jgi:hypothetical protein